MDEKKEKVVNKGTAEKDVILIAKRLASLYLHFYQDLVKELGEEKAKEITQRVIKKYGEESGIETRKTIEKMGLNPEKENFSKGSDLPSMGWKTEKKNYPDGRCNTKITYCPFAEFWIEKGAEKFGRLYCFVDQAKYSGFNPKLECLHEKNVLDGDPYCELAIKKK